MHYLQVSLHMYEKKCVFSSFFMVVEFISGFIKYTKFPRDVLERLLF